MSFLSKRRIVEQPINYHAGVVFTSFGLKLRGISDINSRDKLGRSISSLAHCYAKNLAAPELPHMFAVGMGVEFAPSWSREQISSIVVSKEEEIDALTNAFNSYALYGAELLVIPSQIVRNLGYAADSDSLVGYEESILNVTFQVMADFADKVISESRVGKYGPLGVDAHKQGVMASFFSGLLIGCYRVYS